MKKASLLLLVIVCSIGCGYSSSGKGTVAPGAPTITQLMPNTMAAGGGAFTLTVMGSDFVNGATVYWDSTARTTTFGSSTQVTAAITAADIATASTILVYVKNPGGTGIYMNQGGQSSASVDFTVTP
jgi:IPT/TIG domain-containing protein/uncharacterized protein DUF2190